MAHKAAMKIMAKKGTLSNKTLKKDMKADEKEAKKTSKKK